MKLATTFLLIGLGLVLYSTTLSPYIDQQRFYQEYSQLGVDDAQEYHELRQESLSPKYKSLDYGITLILVAALVALWGHLRRTPGSRIGFVGSALIASGSTTAAYVFYIIQGFWRGEFPHWADTIAIPLAGTPIILAVGIAWAAVHFLFLPRSVDTAVLIGPDALGRKNAWLILVSALTFLVTAHELVQGQYWFAIAGLAWLHYYLSIASVRSVKHGA